ncbi:MAG: Efflux ABC transporter, ATP-binding protein [uncultured Thermoleophilia bacterium]|uniref:Efflux ABC transporter, ATP-binding protein n=1 Tax=uncultured Thermoleophilia bacterium TaxID=1497501 RepID=A0A6J4TC85_9ACTN|nr:MAG: Efflux ABC transporter, ATP-binding protein [uncultured Thermoleophilia bacterium]
MEASAVDEADAIEVTGLAKRYGAVVALDGINLAVRSGEVFGLLGHNGAGKTTTIRILTGRTRPTAGTARVHGLDAVADREAVRRLVNLVFEDQNLYERLTGRENLRVFCRLYGVPLDRADALLESVDLAEAGRRKVKTYSTGMRQRLLIARSLVNQPRVLFLDEPTRGLDPVSTRTLHDLLRGLAADGTTIFLTTHDMLEADVLCDRVAFLSEGRVVALDVPRELKLRFGERRARVLLSSRVEHVIALDDADDAARLEAWMGSGQVLAVHSLEGTLADAFVAFAGRPLDHPGSGSDGDGA